MPVDPTVLLVVGFVLLVLLAFSAVVAGQAHARGYNFLVWLLAGVLGNPLLFLVLLAILPDHARKAQRYWLARELEKKLRWRAQPQTGP